MSKKHYQRDAARRILWGDRESFLPHLLEHRDCGVFAAVEELCRTAGWSMDSFVVAALFNSAELIVQVSA